MKTIRVATVTALVVVTLTSSASAECAWGAVDLSDEGPSTVGAQVAFATQDPCERHAADIMNEFNPRHPAAPVMTICLPDTVDPRGPKTK